MSYDCFCDYESPTAYNRAAPVARIEHCCSECGRRIAPGESYERVFGKWDGRIDTYKTCCRCLDLREYVKAHVPCLCWSHGNTIDDCMDEVRHWHDKGEAPGLLFGAYRRLVKIKSAPRLLR